MSNAVQRHGRFDADAQERFLAFYAEFGMFYKAAAAAGVCGQTVRNHINNDEGFAARFEEAKGQFRDKVEEEITRRAIEGVDEYVTCGKGLVYIEDLNDRDENGRPRLKPLKQRRFSDALLMFHAKRHIPEYREKSTVDHNVQGGVLLIPSGMSADEWKQKHGAKGVTIDQQPEPAVSPTVRK